MSRKILLLSIVLFTFVGLAGMHASSSCQSSQVLQSENYPSLADDELVLADGMEGIVNQSVPTRVVVNASESHSGVDNQTQISFLVNYSEAYVWLKLSFS